MSYGLFSKKMGLLSLLAATGCCAFAQTNVKQYARLQRLPLGAITAQGWLQRQLATSKAGMGGHLDELEPEMIGKPFVDRTHASKVSPGWSGEISGTYWVGLVQLAFTLNDATLKDKAQKWVRGTLVLQEADGYLGSYRPSENRLEDYSAWSANWCYRALLAWYDATGEKDVLEAVHKGLLWFVKNWSGDKKTNYAGPILMESMMVTYLLTGDSRLMQWCEEYLRWLDHNDKFNHGFAALQRTELSFNDDHVVAFGENLKHPALLYMGNGQHELLNSSFNGLRQVMRKCWQITGAPASNFEYLAPPSCFHETEYCNFSTYLNTFAWLTVISGEPRFGDYMEDILFNGAQGARKNDERAIAYMSAPNQFQAGMHSANFGARDYYGVYAPNIDVACCPVQSVRIYPEYVRNMFMRDERGNIFVPLYGPCQANFQSQDGTAFSIEESTQYPFNGQIVFKIKSATPVKCVIFLKLPEWCTRYQMELDGGELLPPRAGQWLAVNHQWHNSELKLNLVMEPRVVAVNDIYFQQEPLRAVKCGSLLFAQHLKESWTPIEGRPLTKLPDNWSWYEVTCDTPPTFYSLPLATATNHLAISKRVVTSDDPWNNPPIRLEVPMLRSQRHAYRHNYPKEKFLLPYGNPVMPDKDAKIENVELIPFGCTTLRVACFTVTP